MTALPRVRGGCDRLSRLLEAVKFTETNMRLPEIGRTRVKEVSNA
jgi:hypothetical protein